jgi:hypothetical protein
LRPDSAIGVVIEPTLGSPLIADGDCSARHLSRTPRTEPRPSAFGSAIKPMLAIADTGWAIRYAARTFCAPPLSSRRARHGQ